MKHHGTGAKILLNNIKYQKLSDLSELNRFLQIMSIEDTNDIYNNTNNVLISFQREFESIRVENKQLSESIQQIISEMNTRLKEQENINRELKSEINSAKALNVELNNKIRENESKLAENARLIQANEAAINEKNKQIQAKDATINEQTNQIRELKGEYPFESDLFSGIFDGLSKKLGRNLADSSDVDVTASRFFGQYRPENVLKNDSSWWFSENFPNSWIQFDFKERKVSITSYSMNDRQRVKSWKVEGSTDGSTFEIIDNKVDTTDFQNSNNEFNDPSAQKNFPVQPNNKYYRYIRITSTSKCWYNYDCIKLYRVEFFGFVQSE